MKKTQGCVPRKKAKASWLMSYVSVATMVFSPLAQARQAERNSAAVYRQAIQETGLNKRMTAQEFFDKNKDNLPGYAYYDILNLVKANPKALMPQFTIRTAKASDGSVIPVVSFTENRKTHNIQIYGNRDKFLKFDNTFLSESESMQPEILFEKLMANDKKLASDYRTAINKVDVVKMIRGTSSVGTPQQFTTMSKDIWQNMTKEQRVSYIIYMRQLYLDAQNVLESNRKPAAAPARGGKKTSSINILEMIYRSFVPEAEAQMPGTKFTTSDGAVHTLTGDECIVAGYVGRYSNSTIKNVNGNTRVCNVEVALKLDKYQPKSGSPLPFVSEVSKKCESRGPAFVACNPIVYSYDSKGEPHCINRSSREFQDATHWSSKGGNTCDQMSRLTNDKIRDIKLRNEKEYKNLTDAEILELDNLEKTRAFLQNYMKAKGSADLASCIASNKVSDRCLNIISEITAIGEEFKKDINAAIKICNAKNDQSAKEIDQRQGGACDQIRKRWLAYEKFIEQLQCPEGREWQTSPDGKGGELKTCEEVAKISPPMVVEPGPVCNPEVPAEECVETPIAEGSCPEDVQAKVTLKNKSTLNANCQCVNKKGQVYGNPTEDQPGLLAKIFNSKKNKNYKTQSTTLFGNEGYVDGTDVGSRQYACKNGPNWWAIAGIGLGVAGLTALIFAKAKTKVKTETITKTVTQTVTNTVDNTVTCQSPKYPVLATPTTAELASTSLTTNKNKYVCVCPPCGRYYMANGTAHDIVPNPVTCACSAPPTEGGSNQGGGDSGGVPTGGKTAQ